MSTSRNLLFLLISLIGHTSGLSQDYYPLRVGNEWFYRSVGLPPSDSTISSVVRVIGDSILPNGKRYSVLNRLDIMQQRFVRVESTYVYYPNPSTGEDQRVFRLDGQVGDTAWLGWGPYGFVRLSRIDTLMIFGFAQRVLTFELHGLLYAVMRLCQRFGPMTEWRYSDPPPPWPEWGRELVGCTINGLRYGHTLGVADIGHLPLGFVLYQNFPNPFNPETRIVYSLPSHSSVLLRVFDLTGREVCTLVDQTEPPGTKSVTWDGRDSWSHPLPSGLYFYHLSTEGHSETRKMTLLR